MALLIAIIAISSDKPLSLKLHHHNHNGIRHRCRHDDQLHTITLMTVETSSSFRDSRDFLFQPLDFEHAIFEDPAAAFTLKTWRICCCIVPYTADVVCSFDFFFDDTGVHCNELLSIFFAGGITTPLAFGIFQKGIIHRIYLFFPYTSQTNSSISHIYFLFTVTFYSIFLNSFIAIAILLSLFKGLTFPLRLNDAVKSQSAKA